jgi:hypothetical protein
VRGAEDPATDTRARVWRAVLEPVVAETPLCCATWAPTVAVGATGSAGGEIEAEAAATGVDTVAVDLEPTATVAVTEVWPGVGTVGDMAAVGVETVGVGTETVGVGTLGVIAPVEPRSEVVTLPTGRPSPSAAPASPPHANNTSAPTEKALRRRARLISHS